MSAEEEDVLLKHGELKPGVGLMSGAIALSLSVLSVFAVIGFRFPQWMSSSSSTCSARR
jgi:hypothetical protein